MNVTKNVPPAGARSAPALGTTSELRRAKRAGARKSFRGLARHARRTFDPNCRLRKLNNAKGRLGSAYQSDNSFTEIQ